MLLPIAKLFAEVIHMTESVFNRSGKVLGVFYTMVDFILQYGLTICNSWQQVTLEHVKDNPFVFEARIQLKGEEHACLRSMRNHGDLQAALDCLDAREVRFFRQLYASIIEETKIYEYKEGNTEANRKSLTAFLEDKLSFTDAVSSGDMNSACTVACTELFKQGIKVALLPTSKEMGSMGVKLALGQIKLKQDDDGQNEAANVTAFELKVSSGGDIEFLPVGNPEVDASHLVEIVYKRVIDKLSQGQYEMKTVLDGLIIDQSEIYESIADRDMEQVPEALSNTINEIVKNIAESLKEDLKPRQLEVLIVDEHDFDDDDEEFILRLMKNTSLEKLQEEQQGLQNLERLKWKDLKTSIHELLESLNNNKADKDVANCILFYTKWMGIVDAICTMYPEDTKPKEDPQLGPPPGVALIKALAILVKKTHNTSLFRATSIDALHSQISAYVL